MYETFFKALGIRMPFSTFECSILQVLNVYPTQFYPNSLSFTRAFTLLCDAFNIAPSLSFFFSFFEVKLRDQIKVKWVSINRIPKTTSLLYAYNPINVLRVCLLEWKVVNLEFLTDEDVVDIEFLESVPLKAQLKSQRTIES